MGAQENECQISENYVFHMRFSELYQCFHNSCEIWQSSSRTWSFRYNNFPTSPYLVLECYQRQFADHSRMKVGRSIWKHERISRTKALLSLKNATITIGKVWYGEPLKMKTCVFGSWNGNGEKKTVFKNIRLLVERPKWHGHFSLLYMR